MRGLAVLLLMILTSTAWAASWVATARSDDGPIFVDQDSLKRTGDVVSYWQKKLYANGNRLPTGEQYDRVMARVMVDCSSDRETPRTVNYYLGDQNVASMHDLPSFDIQPESVAEATARYACRQRP